MNVESEGNMAEDQQDHWARWVVERQFGDDPEKQRAGLASIEAVRALRDRVLANAAISDGDVVLDVGCGSGLIAFGALKAVGEHGRVIFSDISQELLDHCHSLAREMGVLDRCSFVRASADDLTAVDDASVNAVTTRSVLIFVKAKDRAFREFWRVLRPRGRLSIFEPINRFAFPEPDCIYWGRDVAPVQDLASKVRGLYHHLQPSERDPMLDFDERDLLRLAETTGFGEILLELQASVKTSGPRLRAI
jgi:arsenite methyltransferase